jgi:hypothetical protein
MSDDVPGTIEKALAINLDPLKYGTIVEIGAGQEVARWFFQAGAAAGTVAKTMSAYDMNFSDEIYGAATGGRYVSRGRLERMLEQEFDLIISRIKEHRPDGSTFFAFANTVAAQGFKKREECHGWIGVRFQAAPDQEPDDIILHVRMFDDTNVEQQDALGILGVNLIHGAYFHWDDPVRLLQGLTDNLKWGRVEVDLVEFRGPTLGHIDNRLMALELVNANLTPAVLFDPDGHVVIPAEALYKQSVLGMRGEFRPVLGEGMDRFGHAKELFAGQCAAGQPAILMAEMTMSAIVNEDGVDTGDFLERVNALSALGFHVLISEFFRYFRVRQYLARHSHEPVAFVMGVDGFARIMREEFYEGLEGGILEGLGKLFPAGTTAYIYPEHEGDRTATLDDMPAEDHLKPLIAYLRERGQVVAVNEFPVPGEG